MDTKINTKPIIKKLHEYFGICSNRILSLISKPKKYKPIPSPSLIIRDKDIDFKIKALEKTINSIDISLLYIFMRAPFY
jgi:hypothetical protein